MLIQWFALTAAKMNSYINVELIAFIIVRFADITIT